MARIRSIHPGLFTDEAYVSCSHAARNLTIGLWTEADDKGVFEWKPLTLKMKIFPADALDVQAMSALLDELVSADIVKPFDAEGKHFGAIRNFRKFQRPQKPNDVHPLPESLRSYVGVPPIIPVPVSDRSRTGTRKSNQMEDVGCRMEGEEGHNSHNEEEQPQRKSATPDEIADEDGVLHDDAEWAGGLQ